MARRHYAPKPPPLRTAATIKLNTEALAADANFDPDDYKKDPNNRHCYYFCATCGVRHAIGRVCGYCRGRVKMIREGRGNEIRY
jgi:hypothetical protein